MAVRDKMSPRKLHRCFIAAVEAMEPRQLLSTTYYVSPAGNNNNPGTTPATPWQTVAKVNATMFQPGDSVLFLCGAQFHESLSPISSGNTPAPITFGAYGDPSLPNPEFVGSDVLINSTFVPVAGTTSTYSMPSATAINWIYDNHAFTHESQDALAVVQTPSTDPLVNITYVNANYGTFYYDSATTTLYLNLGAPLTGHTITAATRADAIFNNGQSNLIFTHLDVTETAQDNGGYGIRVQGGSNVQVLNCTASLTGKHAIGAINTTGFVAKNVTADQTAPDLGYGGASAFVSFSDSTRTGDTSQWINATYTNPGGPYPVFDTHGNPNAISSILLQNIVSENGFGTGMSCQSTGPNERITILGGKIGDNIEFDVNNSVIDGVTFNQALAGISLNGTNDVVQNCLFTNLAPDVNAGHNGGVVVSGVNDVVRFNTFSFTGGPAVDIKNPTTNANVYANIFDCTQAIRLFFNTTGVQSSNNNLFGPQVSFATHDTLSTLSFNLPQWQAMGYDTASMLADPAFANALAGNYQLTGSSPAIDLYTPTPDATVTPITTDFLGNPRPFGAAYDAGAFEFQAPKIPITGTFSVAGATVPAPLAGTSATAIFTVTLSSAQSVTETVKYATADGTALAGSEYTAESGTLTFAPGVTTQYVNVPTSPVLNANSSKTLQLILSSASSGTALSTATAIATVSNVNETSAAVTRKIAYAYTDAAGHKVLLKVAGAGTATAIFQGRNTDPVQIVVSGTTPASSFTLASTSGAATLADVIVQSALGSFSASANLTGTLTFAGTVGRVSLGNLSSSASIILKSATGRPTIRLGTVNGINFNSAASLASLSAVSWTGAGTTITAPSIASLLVKGAFAANLTLSGALGTARVGNITGGTWSIAGAADTVAAISTAAPWAGSFSGGVRLLSVAGNLSGTLTASSIHSLQIRGNMTQATVSITGVGVLPDLAFMSVGGAVSNSSIRTAGNIGNVSVGATVGSVFFAGVSPTLITLPTTPSNFVANDQIASFIVTAPPALSTGFSNTQVAAAKIGKIRVKGVQTANGGTPFGFATESLAAFTDIEAGKKPFNWTSKQSPSVLTFTGDFKVSVIS